MTENNSNSAALVSNPNDIRLAMVGMVDANGHPYSWSAIINGSFDPQLIRQCPYPVIAEYLSAAKPGELGLPGVKVTHIWCDDPHDALLVSRASMIPNIVSKPEDVIGKVDAVVIPTDKGFEHLERARMFIDAGIPVFIDKPLTDRADHLRQFINWQTAGKPIMSSSCMRYCAEYQLAKKQIDQVGNIRLITCTTPKSWERYGIHALEGAYTFARPGGWISVTHTGSENSAIVHIHHEDNIEH